MCSLHIDVRAVESLLNKPAGVFYAPPVRAIFSLYLEELYLKGEAFYKQFKKYCKAEKNMI